jgi:hypothetical protein
VTTWGFEAEGPSTLQRAGIQPSTFPVGMKVTMTGRPMKDGQPAAIWVLAVTADGKKYDPREGFVRAPGPAEAGRLAGAQGRPAVQ